MEQQKVLWVIFSVALFVLVVVGIGVIWFLPGNHQAAKAAPGAPGATSNANIAFDPYEWAKSNTGTYPGLEGPQAAGQQNPNFTIIYGQTPQQPSTTGAPAVTVPAPAPSLAPTTPATTATRTAAPPQRPQPAVRTAPRTVRVTEHWIQAASYTSNFRAEQAKRVLDEKGIASRIISHEVNGTTYYRVRIGPYENVQEAEKFLNLVKEVNGFTNSYLTIVYATHTVQ